MEVIKGETKRCSKCGEVKEVGEFYREKRARDGKASSCKPCADAYYAKWRESNRERLSSYQQSYRTENRRREFDRRLRRTYGIGIKEYERMYAQQCGLCAICGRTPADGGGRGAANGRFHVDHCHSTGRVRKLLCHRCNTSLGGFEDSIPRLKAAIAYLEEHQSTNEESFSAAQ